MPEHLVLGVGSPMLDLLVNVSDEFIATIDGGKGGMELVSPEKLEYVLASTGSAPRRAPGGSAANTIFGLANLGMPTSLLGKTGKDDLADFYRDMFARMGGDVSRLKVNPGLPTGRCLSLVTPDTERTMRTDLGAAATLLPDDISKQDFQGVSHVHVEGYLLFNRELIAHVLKLAKDSGCSVSLDMASYEVVNASMDILPGLLRDYVDMVFANEEEAAAFSGGGNTDQAIAKFAQYVDTVAVKLGRKGACIRHGSEVVSVPARLVDAVDTTGAGDLWASGFLFGIINGLSPADSGNIGALVSSEVVKVMGASIPPDSWNIIRQSLSAIK